MVDNLLLQFWHRQSKITVESWKSSVIGVWYILIIINIYLEILFSYKSKATNTTTSLTVVPLDTLLSVTMEFPLSFKWHYAQCGSCNQTARTAAKTRIPRSKKSFLNTTLVQMLNPWYDDMIVHRGYCKCIFDPEDAFHGCVDFKLYGV